MYMIFKFFTFFWGLYIFFFVGWGGGREEDWSAEEDLRNKLHGEGKTYTITQQTTYNTRTTQR